jgi:transposase
LIKPTMEDGMRSYVGLDVSQATTAICVVDEDGRTLAEGKVPTCPRAIAAFVRTQAPELIRLGLETGPLAVWLFGALRRCGLPVICLDARHANGLKIAKRSGFKKAKVAVARKLAVILHRIWRDGTEFRWGREVPLAA